jgi:hypothetical protein
MKKPVAFLLLAVLLAGTALQAQKKPDIPVVGILDPVIEGDPSIGRALADTLMGNITLSLGLTGKYLLRDQGDFLEYDTVSPGRLADDAELDSVLFGIIGVKQGGGVTIGLSLYDRRTDRIILTETRETKTYLEVFDAADSLTLSILTAFNGSLPRFGNLLMERKGPARDFYVEIDGIYAGTSPSEIAWLPEGRYNVRVYEKAGRRYYDAGAAEVEILGGETAVFGFSLMPQGEYDRLASARFVSVTDADVPFQASLGRVSAEEVFTVFSHGLETGLVAYSGGRLYMVVNRDGGNVDYGPLLIDLRVPVLKKIFGGGKKSVFIVRKDGFTLRPGREADPVSQITWYGAVVFCQLLSEMEGLQGCYNLDDWSCDFSKNGYRLPTEKEWFQLDTRLKNNESDRSLFERGSGQSGEWCWDYFTGFFLAGKPGQFRAGRENGLDAVIRFSRGQRKRFDMGKGSPSSTFRTFRTLSGGSAGELVYRHDPWPKQGIEPWVLMFNQEGSDTGNIFCLGGGVSYHRNWTNNLSFSAGAGFLATDDPDASAVFVFQGSPFIFGNPNSFAAGLDFYFFARDYGTGSILGPLTLSFSIYIRNISIRFFFFETGGNDGFFSWESTRYFTAGGGYLFGLK